MSAAFGLSTDVVIPRTPVRADVLLDWNESPIGPSNRAVTRVIQGASSLHLYPRGLLAEVTALTAGYLRVSPAEVLLTAGVDEAVDLALLLARRAWVVQPGFDGYAARAKLSSKPVRTIRLGADWQPAGPVPALGTGDMVFLAQPNNPTGNLFRPAWLADLGRAAPYVFLDETYQEFSSNRSVLDSAGAEPGRLVFRSFSKAMGLAGVRLGCLVTGARDMARLRPLQRFQPIDAVSLHAVAGTLEDPAFIRRLTSYVLGARPALVAILGACGLFSRVRDTEANFVLAQPRAGTAAAVLAGLDREGIRVKPCESIGLPGWMRISVGSVEAHLRLRECLSQMPANVGQRPLAARQLI